MAKLAAAGRTQEEIFDAWQSLLIWQRSGSMSLESAVSNLNKAYGGLSGELGESIPEIKKLNSRRIKKRRSNKAYSGRGTQGHHTKDVAATTGTAEQLANAMGDLGRKTWCAF